MNIFIDFPFHCWTKGDLIKFVFPKGAIVDVALSMETIKRIQHFTDDINGHRWYVMDYSDNKIGGELVNLKDKFFSKIADLYMAELPNKYAENRNRKLTIV